MKKLTIGIMMLSLVLGGVALAAAVDAPPTSKNLDLSKLQKITDQEAQQLRGTGGGNMFAGSLGTCTNVCVPTPNNYNYSQYNTCVPKLYLSPGPHK